MKKHLQRLAMLLMLLALVLLAQTTVFAQTQLLPIYRYNRISGTYTEITGGFKLGTTAADDQVFVDTSAAGRLGVSSGATGAGFPIGFDFTYN
ncbi:MAG: hypothetical protein EBS08_07315, partial [Cytophagia bacterium]|nr:hypothetical protein [Cytophagia bacterium]